MLLLMTGCGSEDELAPLSRFVLSEVSVSGITIGWNDEGQQLEVQVSSASDFSRDIFEYTFANSPSTITGLPSDSPYFIRGRSVQNGTKSKHTEVKEFTTLPLKVPSDLRIGSVLGDSFIASWSPIPGASFEYDVSLNENFTQIPEGFESVVTTQNSVLVEVLNPLTQYYFRARAVNGDEKTDYASALPLTTTNTLILTIKSTEFNDGGIIPNEFACAGASPPLHWRNVPEDAKSIALVMCDLDFVNGVYNHWLIFNMTPQTLQLDPGASGANIPGGGVEGTNGLGQSRYFGPCPPAGETHRYTFTLYALKERLVLNSSATIGTFRQAISDKIISTTTMTGLFGQ